MPRRRARAKNTKSVETLVHDEASRRNLPSAEHQPLMREDEQSPVRVAYQRRNRDLDPQLVWRGKDAQDAADLTVNAPPLYIQERVHPKALIDDLARHSRNGDAEDDFQVDMFADFNGLPSEAAKTEFYRHEANWSNRMILGDSLQVMASLAEREGLRGKVQCIYVDPPYGIKFNSNFQWSTTSRDVRDGNANHITREPEQVKAFRDTWRDGIHSYLTYLRDRLTAARDLLAESGSIFVQIGDENVHRVRSLMDEVFGDENFVRQIVFAKTGSMVSNELGRTSDYLIWYAKNADHTKYRQLYSEKEPDNFYNLVEMPDGSLKRLSGEERENPKKFFPNSRVGGLVSLESSGSSRQDTPVEFEGQIFRPNSTSHWKLSWPHGMNALKKSGRIIKAGAKIRWKYFIDDYPIKVMSEVWTDTAGFSRNQIYVVETRTKIVERCILMTTDPGDLVLDPTCGSGTTAYVAEQWGRRWITIDTSRVALALARARVMGARYPFYLLSDSPEGQAKQSEIERRAPSESPTFGSVRQGFVYHRVPHITLRAIANNAEIDVIWAQAQEELEPLRDLLNGVLGKSWEEWEIPREADDAWPQEAKDLHARWWKLRIARQKEIDASIAARADYERLYDKPYEDRRKVRVAGPFTVESISPHRTLGVDEHGEVVLETSNGYGTEYDFADVILDNLRRAGVQQVHKEDRISFSSVTPWPGRLVCAEGRYMEGEEEDGVERRAGIFIGPEFGTVSRADLVEAAREAAEAGFDVLIACAFNYEAHTTEFESLGRVPVLKARMNADLHMANDLKNTGAGNLFVIFGEPDIEVTSGRWLVTGGGRMVANYERIARLSGLGSLEKINAAGRDGLSRICQLSAGAPNQTSISPGVGSGSDAEWTQTLAAIQNLKPADFPLSLTTDHWTQVAINGVDIFDPATGQVRSNEPDQIACWFIDTDYNQESFFVRHAYFLGAADPYKSLKTTLNAEINKEAWATLNSATSRPFEKPATGRIAVKVINHLGDEALKVFRVE